MQRRITWVALGMTRIKAMQLRSNIDVEQLEIVMKETEGGSMEKKGIAISNLEHENEPELDSTNVLQQFLNHISINSIPGITTSQVLELNSNDCLQDAISLLHEKNAFAALITDISNVGNFSERYIGVIDFCSMVLWSIEEYDRINPESKDSGVSGFFSMLRQVPQIGRTKNAVVQLLLQSSGLAWFDRIADNPLSEFGLENKGRIVFIHGDENISDAFHSLRGSQIDAVPVVDHQTKKLIGNVRSNDIHLLLDNNELFDNRKSLPVEKLLSSEYGKADQILDSTVNDETLKSKFLQRMNCPATNRNTDTLKQVMESLVTSRNSCSFLVDEFHHVTGVATLRDVIMQFSPPSMDSRIDGGVFFESALEQSGCKIENQSVASGQ